MSLSTTSVTGMLLTLLMRLIVLFTAMPVHECAHALAADKLGDPSPRLRGRLTLNPFAHLDLFGSLLLLAVGIGWAKPVEVDARNFRKPKRDMGLVALAGPLSNLLFAAAVLIVYKFYVIFVNAMGFPGSIEILRFISDLLWTVLSINISLAVFNLLPVPPLDGSRIFNMILPDKIYWGIMRYERFIMFALMLLMLSGYMMVPLNFLSNLVLRGLDFLTGFINIISDLIL